MSSLMWKDEMFLRRESKKDKPLRGHEEEKFLMQREHKCANLCRDGYNKNSN